MAAEDLNIPRFSDEFRGFTPLPPASLTMETMEMFIGLAGADPTKANCTTDSFVNVHNSIKSMLAIIAVILLVGWLLGFSLHVAGSLIHLVLVVAFIMLALHFLRGNKAV